jgi:hypothetical protein
VANHQLAFLQYFMGAWEGEGHGQPGVSRVEASFEPALRGTFVTNRHLAVFPVQENNTKGEVHEDYGVFSYDKVRKVVVLRQFHVEGFVNQYVLTKASEDGRELVFETEAIENIPPGFRARTTYVIENDNEYRSIFELAPPGAEYSVYSENHLRRK